MAIVTRCPACNTVFRVAPPQLQARNGMVRCGRCMTVFDGFKTLSTAPEPAGARSRADGRRTDGSGAGVRRVPRRRSDTAGFGRTRYFRPGVRAVARPRRLHHPRSRRSGWSRFRPRSSRLPPPRPALPSHPEATASRNRATSVPRRSSSRWKIICFSRTRARRKRAARGCGPPGPRSCCSCWWRR